MKLGKYFQFWPDLDQTWYTYWGSQKRTAHQLWIKPDNSKWPSAVKSTNDPDELRLWWPNLQNFCIYALYMFSINLKRIQWKMKKLWGIMSSAEGHFLYINVKSYDRTFLDIGKLRQRMWIKVSWIFHSNATNPLTSNLQPVQVCLRNYCHISKMAVRPYNTIQKAGRSGTW